MVDIIQKEKAYGDYILLFTILSLLVLLFGYLVIVNLGPANSNKIGKSFLFFGNSDKSSPSDTKILGKVISDVVVCGDGKLDSRFEECDDGNMISGDGCSACRLS